MADSSDTFNMEILVVAYLKKERSKNIILSTPVLTYVEKAGAWRQELNSLWNSLNEGQRVFVPICAANVAVFLMWRIPGLAII